MTTYTKHLLSASTDGKNIQISATGTVGTLIHVPGTGTAVFDEVWIYAVNASSVNRKLTIEYGGVTNPDDYIEATISPEGGLVLLLPGILIQNSRAIRGFADTDASAININGFVNRIT